MTLLQTPPLALYVHFPWCVRKCPYCDFNSYTLNGSLEEDRYLTALEQDIQSQAGEVQGREVISVFLGGGTPSLFPPRAMARLLHGVRQHLKLAADAEVTMEANPGTIERGRFAEYRAAGINRVSLGAQTFDAQRLRTLGRIHSPDETRRAADELHAAGLANFNLDLMYALPGQTVAQAVADIEAAIDLQPAHLSHYQLTLEPGTVFAAQPPPNIPDDDCAAEILAECASRLAAAGFEHYEVSGYARPGRRCRHNLNYWEFGDYVGVGAGAHGKLSSAPQQSIVRTTQPREPRRYLAMPAQPARSVVPEAERAFEFMLNGLRLVHGFDLATFSATTGVHAEAIGLQLEALQSQGLLALYDGRVVPTETGLRFLNEMLLRFLPKYTQSSGRLALSTTF